MSLPHDPRLKVERLRNQIAWVTRLSALLSTAEDPEDLFSLILTGVVSPYCLGYSQVIFFRYDPSRQELVGQQALAHQDLGTFQELAAELDEELAWVAQEPPLPPRNQPQNVQAQAFDRLASNAQWVTVSQRLPPANPITDRIRGLAIAVECDPTKTPPNVLAGATLWSHAHALNRKQASECMPQQLLEVLPEHFAVSPLLCRSGLRGVVIADRRLHRDDAFEREELDELDWFCSQAALALENLEVNRDLVQAYADLKELDQVKSNFLSIISHELRTPLTSVSGFVELLLDGRAGDLTEMQRTLLARVSRNTSHLSHLVNDLLEVAQIEAEGTVEVNMAAVDPLKVLQAALPRLDQRRRQTAVNIHVEVPEEGVPQILTDERALNRMYFHLLDNALKFSPEGEQVVVRLHRQGARFVIEIQDRGVGIEEKALKHIFDYFYQADNSLTRGYEGLGLGLAVTRMLVHATHATIEVRSAPSKGTQFILTFPLASHSSPVPRESPFPREGTVRTVALKDNGDHVDTPPDSGEFPFVD